MVICNRQDEKRAVEILYSAFVNITIENSVNFVVKQDSKRNKRLYFFMKYLFKRTLIKGQVFISDDSKAVLLVEFPKKNINLYNLLILDIMLIFRTIGIDNIFKVIKREYIIKKNHIKEPHIHPIILGVKKEYQNKGIGVKLINEVFHYFSDSNLPIIIETTTLNNIKLYQYFGFKVIKSTTSLGFPLIFLKR